MHRNEIYARKGSGKGDSEEGERLVFKGPIQIYAAVRRSDGMTHHSYSLATAIGSWKISDIHVPNDTQTDPTFCQCSYIFVLDRARHWCIGLAIQIACAGTSLYRGFTVCRYMPSHMDLFPLDAAVLLACSHSVLIPFHLIMHCHPDAHVPGHNTPFVLPTSPSPSPTTLLVAILHAKANALNALSAR